MPLALQAQALSRLPRIALFRLKGTRLAWFNYVVYSDTTWTNQDRSQDLFHLLCSAASKKYIKRSGGTARISLFSFRQVSVPAAKVCCDWESAEVEVKTMLYTWGSWRRERDKTIVYILCCGSTHRCWTRFRVSLGRSYIYDLEFLVRGSLIIV